MIYYQIDRNQEVMRMQESSIAEKIKELRTDFKMNQKNFAEAIGIKQSTLSSYENGVVTPSNDVLLTIAKKFHVSLDWLFGLSESKVQISTLSDIIWVLLQMNESAELRYEVEVNNHLTNDVENEQERWYAGIKFYGNDKEHSLNADMCNFLADLQENRESLESYFTGKDMYEMWKKKTLDYYTAKPVTHQEIEDLDFETRIRKRDQLLSQKFAQDGHK
jgi:transcriptional regulator with XRE-family HTH domain